MDREKHKDEDLPHRDTREIEEEAAKSREKLDKVPPPGTDTLHEGP
jgi:hypothetical protein